MMAITVLTAAVVLVLLRAPDTPIGRRLHQALVVRIAAALSQFRRGHVLLLIVLSACVWLMNQEGPALVAMGAPEVAAWISVVDAATLLDVAAALAITAALVPVRLVGGAAKARWGARRRPGPTRARRPRRVRRPAPTVANDDDPDRARWAA